MPRGHRYAGSEGSSADVTEAWHAPGKRTLTDSIQRKAADPAAVHPLVRVPVTEATGLSCEQSYLDSILDGPVQRKGDGEAATEDVQALAAAGTAGAGGSLPFLDQIQASFGAHDVGGVQAHTDGAAAGAAAGMGATAFASGNHVAFAGTPDLHTAAHEAAHVVQQRAGVHLKGGVGEEGDAYEQHADAVADAVVGGESAEDLLDELAANHAGDAAAMPAGDEVQHKKKKKGPPPRQKADGTKFGAVVQHLYRGEDAIDKLLKMSDTLMEKGRGDDAADAVAYARTMMPLKDEGIAALQAGFLLLSRQIGEAKKPVNAAKAEALSHPGMDIVHTVTKKLGFFLANIETAADKHPGVMGVFNADTGVLVSNLNHIRTNLGLERLGWNAMRDKAQPTLVISAGSVNLGSGTPRDKIQEACLAMAAGWDSMIRRISDAVIKFIHTIEHAQFKEADPGLIGKLWGSVKGLISTAATVVSGTPLAAKIGFAAIEKLLAYEKEMEAARRTADEATFLDQLQKKITGLEQEENIKNGQFRTVIDQLDDEFMKKKADDPDDQWKSGRHVVFGPQAAFLKDLGKRADDYATSVPTTDTFLSQFLTEWVTSNHKEKNTPTLRMPNRGSKEWDGYVAINVRMFKDRAGGGWALDRREGAATLHCPKSGDVAKQLVRSLDPFDLSKLNCDLHIHVTYDAGFGGDDPRDEDVRLDTIRMPATSHSQRVWSGVLASAGEDSEAILRRFRKLEG